MQRTKISDFIYKYFILFSEGNS